MKKILMMIAMTVSASSALAQSSGGALANTGVSVFGCNVEIEKINVRTGVISENKSLAYYMIFADTKAAAVSAALNKMDIVDVNQGVVVTNRVDQYGWRELVKSIDCTVKR